jgi:hypothetical protein
MKDLQSWKTSNGIDFISCVKHIMAVTDFEHRLSLTLEKLNEILDRIVTISSFLYKDL